MENLRWSTSDEINHKNNIIDQLHNELRQVNLQRDEALALQRKELTITFDSILNEHNAAYNKKESIIYDQIKEIEIKFDNLTNENIRLKSEVNQLVSEHETMATDVNVKSDKIRQLQWQLNDAISAAQDEQSILNKEILNVKFLYDNKMNDFNSLQNDYTREVEKVKNNILCL
jgi:chromosome segregation ATPase